MSGNILKISLILVITYVNLVNSEEQLAFPTMPKSELLTILTCLNKVQTEDICIKHNDCLTHFPALLDLPYEIYFTMVPKEHPHICGEGKPIYDNMNDVSQAYDTIAPIVRGKENEEDKATLRKYESCMRKLSDENCKSQ